MKHRVQIDSTLKRAIPKKALERACLATLKHEKAPSAEIAILVVGAKRMQSLNRDHLGHDYVTDVISFELGQTPEVELLGQLVICEAFARQHAHQERITLTEELVRYTVHGTLHLLGYDDHDESERKAMWQRQEKLVRAVMTKS